MKGFREFLEESRAQEGLHHNPHMAALKSLAKNSKSKLARFVIDKHNDLHAADANHHVHSDMYDGREIKRGGNDGSIHGVVSHNEQGYHFDSWNGPSDGGPEKPHHTHPIFKRFEKHGMKRMGLHY